jgi:hypothetical protein
VREAREVEAAVVARHSDGARRDGRQAHDAGVERGDVAAVAVGQGVVARSCPVGWRGFHRGMVGMGWSGFLGEDCDECEVGLHYQPSDRYAALFLSRICFRGNHILLDSFLD